MHTDTPCQSVGSGATKHADFFVSVIDDAEVTDDDGDIVERNNTRKPAATMRARSRSPSRPQQAARYSKSPSAAQPLDIPNERCWESAFTFVRLYELILGRPAGPINCLAIVQRPQMYLNQLQREVITVICEELLHGMSGYGTEDRSVSEKTRLLIKSMISIRNIRAKFYHDDHVLSEAELRGLINHLRHQWIDTELEPKQMNLPMRKKTSIYNVWVRKTFGSKAFFIAMLEQGLNMMPSGAPEHAHRFISEESRARHCLQELVLWLARLADAVTAHQDVADAGDVRRKSGTERWKSGLTMEEQAARARRNTARSLLRQALMLHDAVKDRSRGRPRSWSQLSSYEQHLWHDLHSGKLHRQLDAAQIDHGGRVQAPPFRVGIG